MLSGADPVAHWAGSGRTADPRPWVCAIVCLVLKLARRAFCTVAKKESALRHKQKRIETFIQWECCCISAEILRKPSTEHLVYLLCLETGIRLGEICALQWANIDFSSGTVHTQRTAYRINYGGCTEFVIQAPVEPYINIISIVTFCLHSLKVICYTNNKP